MAKPYSIDLRQRVVDFVGSGGSRTDAARLFQVSRDTIRLWVKQYQQTGVLAPQKTGRGQPCKVDHGALQSHIAANPDATLEEIACHLQIHPTTVHYACKRLRITRKKNNALRRTKRSR